MMMKSFLSAFLIAIMVGGFALVGVVHFGMVQASTDVSDIPKPSVPEFTLKLVAYPYDVPPTYGIDPYTGENVTIQEGYHVENKSIEITIKNQPFTPYTDVDGQGISLYYSVSMKGHYENDWNYYPRYKVDLPASGSNYTVVLFTFSASFKEGYFVLGSFPGDVPAGGKVDFRVQALIGFYTYSREPFYFMDVYDVKFTGETSGWSETQTLTIDITPPTVFVVSPENNTYSITPVHLRFTVSKSTSWIGYSLDGQANVPITGNTTIIGLSEGPHTLVVYATDTYGNTGASETFYFTAIPSPPKNGSYDRFTRWAELAVAVSLMIVAAVAAALLIYFAKVKKTTGEVKK